MLASTISLILVGFPAGLGGLGIVLVIALIGIDVALISLTGGLAFARGEVLDERQMSSRDRAYRLSMGVLGLGLTLTIVLSVVASNVLQLTHMAGLNQRDLIGGGLEPRLLVCVVELILITPTAVIAWLEPAGNRRHSPRATLAAIALATTVAAAGWLLAFQLPTRLVTVQQPVDSSLSFNGAHCRHFAAAQEVGRGLSVLVRMHTEVCWTGGTAFVFGNPTLPAPFGSPNGSTANVPYLSGCVVEPNAPDFGSISNQHCTQVIDSDGTLHYLFRARVSPGPLDTLARDVAVGLVVTRDGRVLRFG